MFVTKFAPYLLIYASFTLYKDLEIHVALIYVIL